MPQRGMNQGVIQIGTGRAIRIKYATDLVCALGREHGYACEPFFDVTMPEGDKGRIAVLDRAEAILGWRATVAFEDGIRRQFIDIHERIRFDRPAIQQHPSATDAPFIPQVNGVEELDGIMCQYYYCLLFVNSLLLGPFSTVHWPRLCLFVSNPFVSSLTIENPVCQFHRCALGRTTRRRQRYTST